MKIFDANEGLGHFGVSVYHYHIQSPELSFSMITGKNTYLILFIETSLERSRDCRHLEPKNEYVRSFLKELWTKENRK